MTWTHAVTVAVELTILAWVLCLLRVEYRRWRKLVRQWIREEQL